jgi:hypothetical protein
MESGESGHDELIDGDRIHLGMALNAVNASFNQAKKVFTQARLLALIPIVGRCYIIVGLRCENNALNHAASVPAASPAPTCDLMMDAVKNVLCDGVIQRASPPKQTVLRPLGRYCPKGLQQVEGAQRD